jgi:polysaccharide export outer membrane protein
LIFPASALTQQSDHRQIPISIDDILRQQTQGVNSKESQDLNERIRSMAAVSRYAQDYLLGPGDIIEVTVFGIKDLEKNELPLDSEGKISLPFINQVQVLGLTAREAEVKIAALFEATVMKNPQVSVSVKECKSQFINVLGAVFKPGTYQLTRKVFLVDALAMAGGLLSEKAESKAYLHRGSGNPTAIATSGLNVSDNDTIEIDLVQLLEKGDVSLNLPIYAGDVISVPEREDRFYYVLGDVNRGGAFEIRKGERLTLTKALASAGGLLPTAKGSKTVVIRQTSDGAAAQQLPVDVQKLLKGQMTDMELAQNDVVFVPGSTTKTVGKGLFNSLGGILSALVYVGVR